MKVNHISYTNIDEIDYYSTILKNTDDPIKKKVFNFHQLSQLFSKISSFPVSKTTYFSLKDDFPLENILIKYLALSYSIYRQISKKEHTYIKLNAQVLSLTEDFIYQFYAFDLPIKDHNHQELLWIYPKLQYKHFLADCILLGNYNDYCIDISTIEEIVQIMAGFTRYELDQTLAETNSRVNFPSLIYANIKLYEKGYLEVTEGSTGIEIRLNLKPESSASPIFSRYSYPLKKTIIDICKKSYNEHYSYKDFQ
ncbi:hypothetical protein HNQ80_002790 [Anaerosolibacter carboniphilus]|uniref:Uncharacterized protein n=1 Tax=Anaerosolibacter carboniphilus TaxID=1417629 RepID=A0A841KSX2_9FIRM|nr:hypothetical protein [Anaerosolibacter carboniphilus]MBB6216686.1 hypothetical protein [Anaerosolibacter carboniphilus]